MGEVLLITLMTAITMHCRGFLNTVGHSLEMGDGL
jgi:hypothetical protein